MDDFDFSQLPFHLQGKIIEKLTYKDFAVFDQTSVLAHDICWARKYSFRYVVPQIFVEETGILVHTLHYNYQPTKPFEFFTKLPLRITAQNLLVSGQIACERMSVILSLFQMHGTRATVLKLKDNVTFKPDHFEQLVQILSPKFFTCNEFFPRALFRCPGILKMEYLSIGTTDCTDEEILTIEATDMEMTTDHVTSKGLNELLKQWKRKEREIESICIKIKTTAGARNYMEVLNGIEPNPIWTLAMHEDSILKKIPFNELDYISADVHFYSIWRHEDPKNTVIVELTQEKFHAFEYRGETKYLMTKLSDEQVDLVNAQTVFKV